MLLLLLLLLLLLGGGHGLVGRVVRAAGHGVFFGGGVGFFLGGLTELGRAAGSVGARGGGGAVVVRGVDVVGRVGALGFGGRAGVGWS